MGMRKIVIANWKMNPSSAEDAVALAKATDVQGIILAPPFPFLASVREVLKSAVLGAQDLSIEEAGPFTGEVSASQLVDLGVKYVIVGHSERRRHLGESDEFIAKKVAAAARHGLIPVLCVGETKEERSEGNKKAVVERQVGVGLSVVGSLKAEVIIAYEPVWAIGVGEADTPEDTLDMVRLITSHLQASGRRSGKRVIYGGSVTGANAKDFFAYQEIEGALVGGASLKGKEIKAISEVARHYD